MTDGASAQPYCKALVWINIGSREYPVFPFIVLKYLGGFLLTILIIIFLTETYLNFNKLETPLETAIWVKEVKVIDSFFLTKPLVLRRDLHYTQL